MGHKVVYTDHTFDELGVERGVFEGLDVELVDGERVDPEPHFADADALAVMFEEIDGEVIDRLADCQVVSRVGIGVDNFDIEALTERGIYLANVPDYCIPEVSDHAIALLLALERNVTGYDRSVKGGEWDVGAGPTMRRLTERTLGLVSFGKIARAVARKADAIGYDVLAFDPYIDEAEIRETGVEPVGTLDELLERSGAVSVHAPLTPETEGLFDEEAFATMADDAYLVNAARGPIVDQDALVDALDTGEIAGVALDVLETEPPGDDNPLLDRDRAILTPHAAWHSAESERELREKAARNVRAVLEGGRPEYLVNTELAP